MTLFIRLLGKLWRKQDNHQAGLLDEGQPASADVMKLGWRLPLFAIAISVSALVVTVRERSWLQGSELQVYDQMMRVFAPKSTDPRLLIVTIGENEYNQKNDNNLIQAIKILQKQQARTIAIGGFMPLNNQLGTAIADRKNILVTCFSNQKKGEVPPPPGIEEFGFSDLITDKDSSPILRRTMLAANNENNSKCATPISFAALAAVTYLETLGIKNRAIDAQNWQFGKQIITTLDRDAGSYENFDNGGFQTLVHYRHPKTAFAQLSLQNLLSNQFSPDLIKDKLVLIGVTAPSVHQGSYTPFTGDSSHEYNRMPSIFIHAQITSHLLDIGLGERKPIWYWHDTGEYIWILLWSTVGAVVAWGIRQPLLVLVSETAIAVFIIGVGFIVFALSGWIPIVPPVLALSFSSLGMIIYKAYQTQIRTKVIILQVEKQQQAIAQLNALLEDSKNLQSAPSDNSIRQTGELLLGSRYKIIRVLASGGFGCTYLAKDTQRPGTPTCVVKQLMPARRDPRFLEVARRLFTAEAEILQILGKHRHIPNLLAYLEENQEFYLVQEYIPGRTLEQELGASHPETFVVGLLIEILEILEFVHTHRVIHRDIKPGNIIRCKQDNRLVLIDFGAVKTIQPPNSEQTELATVAIGTRGYAPPEQLAGHPRTSSDIYAVGVIAIQALTGFLPQNLTIDPNTGNLEWHQFAQVSPEFARILQKMTSYYFGDRYQSAREVLADLRQLQSTER